MPIVRAFQGRVPVIGRRVFLADTAVLVGDVQVDDDASVWFGAVLRGDVGPIRVGARSNIQDNCCIHTTGGLSEAHIGDDVTVGHGAVLHGCRVGDRCLIGMGAILLDNAQLGEECVVGAGALITGHAVIPPRSLVLGRPARVVREATEQERRLGLDGAQNYLWVVGEYRR